MKRISTKQIGDGKLPNKYWVSQSEDYYLRTGNQLDWASKEGKFKAESKTLAVFNSYVEALKYADTIYDNSIFIEDRLSGELLHNVKIVCPCCGKEDWETFEDLTFTEEKLGKPIK